MKLFVPALCLAGSLIAGAAYADHKPDHRIRGDRGHYYTENGRYYIYAGEPLYYRQVLFPNLPSEEHVASRLSELITKNRTEIAHLAAFSNRAQTVGYTNAATTYDFMIRDHQRLIDMAGNWLRDHEFPVPQEPTAGAISAADISVEATVDHALDMHVKSFDETLAKLRTEPSSTVRGMMLMGATTTARHISWLRTLDRDVEFGRKSLSAALRAELEGINIAANTELFQQIIEEERAVVGIVTPAPTPQVQVIEVERIVEVEKPVERIVERVVEKPVIVEKIVEKPVYVERIVERPVPTTRSRVAGQRQIRVRRPAK